MCVMKRLGVIMRARYHSSVKCYPSRSHTQARLRESRSLSRGQAYIPCRARWRHCLGAAWYFIKFHCWELQIFSLLVYFTKFVSSGFSSKGRNFKKLNFKSSCIKSCSLPWMYLKNGVLKLSHKSPNRNELKRKCFFEKGRPKTNQLDQGGQGPHQFHPPAFMSGQPDPMNGS